MNSFTANTGNVDSIRTDYFLVVEDDPDLLELILKIVTRSKVTAVGASNGAEALKMLAEAVPAAILLDQSLPDMKGSQIITEIHRRGQTIPFIVMTGQGDEYLAVEMMKLGASDYLIKDTDFLDMLSPSVKRLVNSIQTEKAFVEARDQLKRSELQYKELANGITDIFFALDLDLKCTYWNVESEKIFGVPANDAIGRNIKDILSHAREFESAISHFNDILISKIPQTFLCEYRGSFLEIRGSFTQNGISIIARDITQRKVAEESLRASESKFRTYIESAPEGIFIVDHEGHYLDVNPAACRMTGYSKDELLLLTIRDIASPEDFERGFSTFIDLLNAGEVSSEMLIRRKDGSDIHVLMKGVKFGEDRYISYCSDMTQHKTLQDRLQHAEKMTAIGQLAGGIAHDFNNQLTGILGYANLLAGRLEDPTHKRFAENIGTAARRASDLTKQLLSFSRKGKYLSIAVDIHKIISEVIDILQHSASKKIEIDQFLNADPSSVIGDPSQLQSAILNLAVNACDAMPDGGTLTFLTDVVQIAFDASTPEVEPGDFIQLSVQDTGKGIEPDVIKRIFEPFFTTKDVGKGTGLGLAAVHGAVVNHKGTVRVESTPGVGTRFDIAIPVLASATREKVEEAQTACTIKTVRLLVIDDEQIVLDIANEILRSAGHTVTSCPSPKNALQIYADSWREIDIVVLDMIMPDLDGKEVYREIRRINPHAKVIIASGYSLDHEVQRLVDDGAVGYVQKPFDTASLTGTIQTLYQESLPPGSN